MNLRKTAGLVGILLLIGVGLWSLNTFVFTDSSDEILQRVEQDGFSGVILMADGGTITHHQGYGFASCDDSVPNSADTVLAIGSITKMFTRVAIGQLDDQNLLNIDDPIGNYFDGLPSDKEEITIAQLLDHRAGLETYHETKGLGDFESMTSDKALAEITNRPLRSDPGRRENYSNSGYTLLALLIEEVTGRAYTDYIRENLLVPAGMASSGFWGEEIAPMASTPNTVLGCSSPDEWEYSYVLVGNGGMVSTAADLHRWVLALQGDTILSQPAKARIGIDRALNLGFGEAGGSSQHEFNATVEYDGRQNITVVAISNRNSVPAEDFGIDLLRAVRRETD